MFNINNLKEFELEFSKLGNSLKTKDLDLFSKKLLKEKINVSFLKDIVLDKQIYHRIYFQVSLGQRKTVEEQFKFIEENFEKLSDWWHVDQLTQFINKSLSIDYAYSKAKEYIKSSNLFARRWGYVMFMPTLVKSEESFEKIIDLLQEDNEYYVIMAQAWLISYMAIYYPEKTLDYLKTKPLGYNITTRAIQKICDSFRISDDYKKKFREIRNLYR